MASVIIYHNSRCSKSRASLALLEEKGASPVIIDYLQEPPSRAELEQLRDKLALPAKAMARTNDEGFLALAVDLDDDEAVLDALAKHPQFLERPIVVSGEKAVLGRPPENVHKLF